MGERVKMREKEKVIGACGVNSKKSLYVNYEDQFASRNYAQVDDCILKVTRAGQKEVFRVFVNEEKCKYKKGNRISLSFSNRQAGVFSPFQCSSTPPRKLNGKNKEFGSRKAIGADDALLDDEYKD